MKKASSRSVDDLRPEYDFSSLKGGVRGKYVRRFQSATNLVLLEPDLAAAFPSDEAVNEALRTVVRASRALKRAAPPNKGYLDSSVKVNDGGGRGAGAEPLPERAPLGAPVRKTGRRPNLSGGRRSGRNGG